MAKGRGSASPLDARVAVGAPAGVHATRLDRADLADIPAGRRCSAWVESSAETGQCHALDVQHAASSAVWAAAVPPPPCPHMLLIQGAW